MNNGNPFGGAFGAQSPAPAQSAPSSAPAQSPPAPTTPAYAPPSAPAQVAAQSSPAGAPAAVDPKAAGLLAAYSSNYRGVGDGGRQKDTLYGGPNESPAYYLLEFRSVEVNASTDPKKAGALYWALRCRVLFADNSRSHPVVGQDTVGTILKNLQFEMSWDEVGGFLSCFNGLHPVSQKAEADRLVTRDYITTSVANHESLVGRWVVVKAVDGTSPKGIPFTNYRMRPVTEEARAALGEFAQAQDQAGFINVVRQIAES